ncbi:hypothetical protein BC835DRAFT_1409740 [Cytidiella melzeri]|nr:hypothetical protein BC835DRAFT_1409740 [Cytidiella melzeri]
MLQRAPSSNRHESFMFILSFTLLSAYLFAMLSLQAPSSCITIAFVETHHPSNPQSSHPSTRPTAPLPL